MGVAEYVASIANGQRGSFAAAFSVVEGLEGRDGYAVLGE
jgi:hypothetical protein